MSKTASDPCDTLLYSVRDNKGKKKEFKGFLGILRDFKGVLGIFRGFKGFEGILSDLRGF